MDSQCIKSFDVHGDEASVSQRWKRWIGSFRLFAEYKGITSAARKKAMLLYHAGEEVQEIWGTLPDSATGQGAAENDTGDAFECCVDALTAYFMPKRSYTYERFVFRQLRPTAGETSLQFLTRMKAKVVNCDYEKPDREIVDMLIEHTTSHELRRELLKVGDVLSYDRACELARSLEQCELQAREMEGLKIADGVVNRLSIGKTMADNDNTCFRCGLLGHYARDACCPARGKKCSKCGRVGHFAARCKEDDATNRRSGVRRRSGGHGTVGGDRSAGGMQGDGDGGKLHRRGGGGKRRVRNLEDERGSSNGESGGSSDDGHMYAVNTISNDDDALCAAVGGVEVRFMIDSGASQNIIDRSTWERCRRKGILGRWTGERKKLYPYGSNKPLESLGRFDAELCIPGKAMKATFYVLNCKGIPLLGRKTSRELGVLLLGNPLHMVKDRVAPEGKVSPLKERIKADFPNVFKGLGKLKGFKLRLTVKPEVRPVKQNARKVPIHVQPSLEGKLREMEDRGIIESVDEPSEWVSPLVCGTKKSGELRVCLDARQVNNAIEREVHPIPSIDQLTAKLHGATVFSVLDMNDAFNQIEIDEQSRRLTTFITHKGRMRFTRLLFGLNCAPECFQREIERVISPCEGVVNYFDDFLVWGGNQREHDGRLNKLLKILEKNGLTLNWRKCTISEPKVEFRGHLFSKEGVQPLDSRIDAVVRIRAPTSKAELSSLLGLIGYSAKFIPNYSAITHPLRAMLKGETDFVWSGEHQRALDKLKNFITSYPVLAYYSPGKPTFIVTDAGPSALGAVLLQRQQGEMRIIEYASRALTDVETRYSQTEKEALGLVFGCEKFKYYTLGGPPFTLITDHKPLEFIFSKRSRPCARIERWVLRLQCFDFAVKYRPGKTNIADALSRLVENEKKPSRGDEDHYVWWVASQSVPKAMKLEDIQVASAADATISRLRESILSDKWPADLRTYELIKSELCVYDQVVLRHTRILMPASLRDQVLTLAHEGHPGIVKTKQRLRPKVWWPNIDRDVERKCKQCEGCRLVDRFDPPEPVRSTDLPEGPWRDIAIDYLGPLPTGEHILVAVDYYSRWVEAYVTRVITAERTVEILEEIFSHLGIPETLRTDRAQQFCGTVFRDFCDQNAIRHLLTTPRWPQANGEVERQNRSIMKRVKIAHSQGVNMKKALRDYLFTYRTTSHSTTGVSPAKLMFGRELRDKVPSIHERGGSDTRMRDQDYIKKAKMKDYADAARRASESTLRPGDRVLVRQEKGDKFATNFSPSPFQVLSKYGNAVVMRSPEGKQVMRNTSFVTPIHLPSQPHKDEPRSQRPDAVEQREETPHQGDSPPLMRTRRSSRERRRPARYRDFM